MAGVRECHGDLHAGKTTLVNLLMRFYELDGGRITVDGIDIREMRRDDLRRTFGMVLQDAWLFKGTIRDNITYGRDGATEDEIVEAVTGTNEWLLVGPAGAKQESNNSERHRRIVPTHA